MNPTPPQRPVRRCRKHGQRGIAVIEAFLFVTILGIALLWHAASNLSGYRLMRAEASHGTAIETLRHFVERMRTDPNWDTLFARLAAASVGVPAGGHPPTTYYADFVTPAALGTVGVLVDVPQAAAVWALPGDPLVLREDIDAARFGLPYDLNGDGVVDGNSRNDDYRALPVVVQFNWAAPGDLPQSLRLFTYLRGVR